MCNNIIINLLYVIAYFLLGARGQFELVMRIKEVAAKEKCPRNSYDLGDAATSVF